MGFEIIEGRNFGYPCIPEMTELTDGGMLFPYCGFMPQIPAEGGYPIICGIPESPVGDTEPLPDFCPFCLGKSVNGGYPWLMSLETIANVSESSLCMHDSRVKAVYLNERPITRLYFGDETVFDVHTEKRRLV